ncbi:hypothetical protein Taro_030412 [Colocasia esculenta]|uniref:Pentatricopeptide repeat-containing protein n=1 Tax=Colocasia esculenta TaxID=4460 RepID=A0A843VLD2_COLES|nr:hypothetical protein [Colocasia esculenta]
MSSSAASLRRLLLSSRRLPDRTFSSSASASAASPVTDPSPSAGRSPTTPRRKGLKDIVDSLFKERNLDLLISRFKEISAVPRFRCKHRIYEVAVQRLAGAGRLDGVAEILEAQKGYPEDIAQEGFAARIIGLYGRAGMAAAAEETFRQLPALGCCRTVMSFNAVLTACADAGDFDRLDELFRKVPAEEGGIAPNEVSYNIMIGSLCKRKDLDAAMCVLDMMDEREVQPSLITFNTLLNGYYQNGRFSDAEKVWAKMADKDCKPDTKCFNAKLRGLVMEARTAEAAELVAELPSRGLKPDTFSFNSLIKGYCQDGNLDNAKKVFDDLPKNECFPNRETFETLVPVVCQAGQLDFALRMCIESMSKKCYVAAEVLQEVVDAVVKESKIEDAEKLVALARSNLYSKKSLKMPQPMPRAK